MRPDWPHPAPSAHVKGGEVGRPAAWDEEENEFLSDVHVL